MKLPVILFCLCASLASPAMALYRCKDANGALSFQDRRCPDGAQEQALGSDTPAPLVSGPDDSRRAQQVQQNQEASTRALRKSQLEGTLVPEAHAALSAHRSACDQELSRLRAQRDGSSPRLLAQQQTLESSLLEAQGRCDRRGRELADRLETLRAECAALQCSAR